MIAIRTVSACFLAILPNVLVAAGQTPITLTLDNQTNVVSVDPARVKSPGLPAGSYEVVLGGEGTRQGPRSKRYHYAYIAAYGPDTEFTSCLSSKGDSVVINLPEGGIISAFLQDSFADDNSGSIKLTIRPVKSGTPIFLFLDSRRNVVIVDPARVKTPALPKGKYKLTLGGEGVQQGPSGVRFWYAFIAAYGKETEITACLSGKGDEVIIKLPNGGIISAFLQDSFPADNLGSVTITVEQLKKVSETL